MGHPANATYTSLPRQTFQGYRRPVVADWRELVEGDSIVLIRPEQDSAPVEGTVDAVTRDGELIWVLTKGGRRMYHRIDGYKTLLDVPPGEALMHGVDTV